VFNLLIVNNEEAWEGDPVEIRTERFLQYTELDFKAPFEKMPPSDLARILKLPCIFAYEKGSDKPPKFGQITKAVQRGRNMRICYEIIPVDPFISQEQLHSLESKLDVYGYEFTTTHWAVKDVDLAEALLQFGVELPGWTRKKPPIVDLRTHTFQVALSFPGEVRDIVKEIAEDLNGRLGAHSCFYDWNYLAQLSGPSLDLRLQAIYSKRSKLVVVFLSSDYQGKKWCGIEWRAIREVIMERDPHDVMFIRTDDGEVEGIFKNDGYIDARLFRPHEIADFIYEKTVLAE
jgi:hypothetical protein